MIPAVGRMAVTGPGMLRGGLDIATKVPPHELRPLERGPCG
jgi:hypothetical protein